MGGASSINCDAQTKEACEALPKDLENGYFCTWYVDSFYGTAECRSASGTGRQDDRLSDKVHMLDSLAAGLLRAVDDHRWD